MSTSLGAVANRARSMPRRHLLRTTLQRPQRLAIPCSSFYLTYSAGAEEDGAPSSKLSTLGQAMLLSLDCGWSVLCHCMAEKRVGGDVDR